MSPLEFYLSEQNDPSILSFVDEKALDLSLLKNKPVGFVEDNFLTFEATRAILWGGARRVSTDGKWLEFASLAESIRLPVDTLDINQPINLFLIKGNTTFQCKYVFNKNWQGYSPSGALQMQAIKDSNGIRKPLVNMRSFRGENNKFNQCLIWLPAHPTSIEYIKNLDSGEVDLKQFAIVHVKNEKYWLEKDVVSSIFEGWATIVLPDENGYFTRHEAINSELLKQR